MDYLLYTYKPGTPAICHGYVDHADGSPLSQEEAQAAGEAMQAADPTVGFMVLPCETLPTT